MNVPGLELCGVCLQAGEFRVSDVSLTIPAGEYFILMGHTGAGKSLVMKAVCGLWPLSSGWVAIAGQEVTHLEPHRRGIGYVPQESGLFPHMDVAANIGFALDLMGLNRGEIDNRVRFMAAEVGVTQLLDRRIRGLSGGERQKVALARALTRQPRLLLLDEPVSALDERSREDICELLKRVHEQYGLTTIHICHNRAEAELLGHRIAVMNQGVMAAMETRKQVT